MINLKENKLSELSNGRLVGGFTAAFTGKSAASLTDKNTGQCVTANNCVAGANCARSCWDSK